MRTGSCLFLTALVGGVAVQAADVSAARQQLSAAAPGVRFTITGGQLTDVFGVPFSFGATPELSAQNFVQQYAPVFNVSADELAPGNTFNDELTSGMMWNEQTGQYRGTLVYYRQYRDGIPVYKGELRLLTGNTADSPLVWAGSSLREMGDFHVDPADMARIDENAGQAAALNAHPGLVNFGPADLVVWGGLNQDKVQPALALAFTADNGMLPGMAPEKFTFVTHAVTGAILHEQSEIHHVDVNGTVSGLATTGSKSGECNPEASTPLKYAKVSIGATSVFADGNGSFTIPNAGATQVAVTSLVEGQWFKVFNQSGANSSISTNVTPPGPATIVHNSANNTEQYRAEVNGYVQANVVRDFALTQDPNYPTIKTQTSWPVNVNLASTCNAYYNGSSINFYLSGGGCANTTFSTVVHHEYGHHMVSVAGSGQGQYGEGMGDCMGMLILDDPVLAYGFQNNCNAGIRSALNFRSYPCSAEIHDCGQLISGCVWGTRTNLAAVDPANALAITSKLTVNSIKMHTGTEIQPNIATHFLTLDDLPPGGDNNIGNGTPHYTQICQSFNAHNMTCPAILEGLKVTPASDLDSFGQPGGPFSPNNTNFTLQNIGGATFNYTVASNQTWVTLTNAAGSLANGNSVVVNASINANANALAVGTYTATLTFTNTSTGTGNTTRRINLYVGGPQPVYTWNLDANPGWTTTGLWAWGTPTGASGDHGGPDPNAGYTGTRVYGYNLTGGYTNNQSEQTLTTGPINCSNLTQTRLRFRRWLGVEENQYDHAYVRISTNGTTWTNLWSNPVPTLDDQAWVLQDIDISAIANGQSAVRIRWVMGTTDGGWTFCGWNIDDIEIWGVQPQAPCPGDANGNRVVNQDDLDMVLFFFGTNQPAGTNGDVNGNGVVNQDDLDLVLFNFGTVCP